MDKNIIGLRPLSIKYKNGDLSHFNITVSVPHKINDEYGCEVNSDDVIFSGKKIIYGIDGIDAVDNSINFIDRMILEFEGGLILWPDGSPYIRSPVENKMSWGSL